MWNGWQDGCKRCYLVRQHNSLPPIRCHSERTRPWTGFIMPAAKHEAAAVQRCCISQLKSRHLPSPVCTASIPKCSLAQNYLGTVPSRPAVRPCSKTPRAREELM